MSKFYSFARDLKVRNVIEDVEVTEYGDPQMLREREVRRPDGELVHRWLGAAPQAIDPDDNPTYKGDRLIPRGEEHEEADGKITQVMERVDDLGRTIGTYEFTWEQTGERQMTNTKSRKIHS